MERRKYRGYGVVRRDENEDGGKLREEEIGKHKLRYLTLFGKDIITILTWLESGGDPDLNTSCFSTFTDVLASNP